MKKICVTNISKDSFWQLPEEYKDSIRDHFEGRVQFTFVESTSGMRDSLKDCDMIVGMPFSKAAVKKNTNLKKVHFWTAQVPLSWQGSEEIQVTSSSGVNSSSVAEHGLYLIMKALRGEIGSEDLRRDGFLIAQSPKDLTCGVIGLGNIGKSLVPLLRPLFGNLLGLSRSEKIVNGLDKFYTMDKRNEFYSQCDYLVLCLPLTNETQDLFKGDEFYSNLKSDSVLINLSRGELFDESEIINFLSTHMHARYLTDVTYPEPYPEDGLMNDLDNIFITPHIGGRREDIWKLINQRTIEEIEKWS